jgi:hypothetical protein
MGMFPQVVYNVYSQLIIRDLCSYSRICQYIASPGGSVIIRGIKTRIARNSQERVQFAVTRGQQNSCAISIT